MSKKINAVLEVGLVFIAVATFLLLEHDVLKKWLIWDEILFGFPAVSKYIMFCGIPSLMVLWQQELRPVFGVRIRQIGNAFRFTIHSYSFLGPACAGFWLLQTLQLSPHHWEGSLLLTLIFGIAAYLALRKTEQLPSTPADKGKMPSLGYLHLVPLILMLISFWAFPKMSLLSAVIHYFFFVGFGEELLFRGYIQSRLNLAFGKPYKAFGISFGWGLILSSALFGLIHIFNTSELTWAWALYPIPLGVLFGFLREKTGDVLAPALLHGLIDLPLAFIA